MHLPDGFLDIKTTLVSAGAAATGLGIAVRQVRCSLPARQMPLLGLAGAFIFAAQMLNFPVPGGTSGHLLGGPLAAVLLGPAPAVIVMACVLLIQALVFCDGGVTALGANVLNMAIVSVVGGYLAFRFIRDWIPVRGTRGIVFAAAFAGWVGTVLSAMFCAGELALAGSTPWQTVFPAMTSVHMFIGVGEGLATGLITAAISRARPELVVGSQAESGKGFVGVGLAFTVVLAVFVAPFACPWPDGLERVAARLGFAHTAKAPTVLPLLSDWQAPFFGSPVLSTAVAALAGTLVTFAAAYLLARFLVPAQQSQPNTNACE